MTRIIITETHTHRQDYDEDGDLILTRTVLTGTLDEVASLIEQAEAMGYRVVDTRAMAGIGTIQGARIYHGDLGILD